ncbi:MAG TPA: twin-arginine translocase TatA/TatE family subunit [Candidatus Thermoplasmatota archaeon]|nr:twin-arginine translocase TatA/TatE family subunit [Candidatus Thermoplasmatota archaeon]
MPALALFQSLGLPEILIILVVLLVLFGSTKIPALMRALGRSQSEFTKAKREAERELDDEDADARVLRRARELGVATDGRSVADIRRDVEARETKPG